MDDDYKWPPLPGALTNVVDQHEWTTLGNAVMGKVEKFTKSYYLRKYLGCFILGISPASRQTGFWRPRRARAARCHGRTQ